MHQMKLDERTISFFRQRVSRYPLHKKSAYHEVIARLLERLNYIRIQPETVINMGWRAQAAHSALQTRYPSATIFDETDSTALASFPNQSVDLIILHFALLCEKNPTELLKTCNRILRNDGLLLFMDCGPDTLKELRASFATVDSHPHVHTFVDMHNVGDWLRELQFLDPVMDCEMLTFAYDDLNQLFDELRTIGLMNADLARSRGLLSKNKWLKMIRHYEGLKTDDYYPASFEIIYGHGWKTKVRDAGDEICISIDAIQRN